MTKDISNNKSIKTINMKTINLFFLSLLFITINACKSDNNGLKILNEKKISSAEYGEKWPLTIDEGILQCVQFEVEGLNPEILRGIVLKTADKTYSVNGVAVTHGTNYGFEEISTITKVDEKSKKEMMDVGVSEKDATIKMDIGFLLEDGQKLCK